MRLMMLAAVAAFSLVGPALAFEIEDRGAATPLLYKLDAAGRCHGPNGQYVYQRLCVAPSHPVCHAGVSKPCGNTCIALNKVCHV